MKYQKTVYNNTCETNPTVQEYYENNSDASEFDTTKFTGTDLSGNSFNTCKECCEILESLKRVRGDCHQGENETGFYNTNCSSMDCKNCSMCSDCNQNSGCSGRVCGTNCGSKNAVASYKAKLKKIQKTVRVSSSEYSMNKSALNVFSGLNVNKTAGNASDRMESANVPLRLQTPRHPSSLSRTKFSLKPGAMNVGGVGVDVKHNSYARYLAKKKGGRALRAEQQTDTLSDKKQNIVMGYYVNTGCCN